MKKLNIIFIAAIVLAASFATSCKKDDDNDPKFGDFKVDISHVWGMDQIPFEMNKLMKHPMTGDSIEFNLFKYYISNIQLQKEDGSWWTEENSYYLLDLSKTDGTTFTIQDVPEGSYKAIRYVHGVDSTRNVSGAQEGALSVANGMFWSWNSGYIMIKIEGNSPQSDDGQFAYHMGGFSGDFNLVTEKEASFGSSMLNIKEGASSTVKLQANPARFWHSVGSISGIQDKIHMPSATTTTMGKSFAGATAFIGIE